MKLPAMLKQITEAEGESRIYIEDYVYSYLNELKMQNTQDSFKAALFGYSCSKGTQTFRFIYGAACLPQEAENSGEEAQIWETYFGEYELLGYVKLRPRQSATSEKGKDYCIFYDTNEAMQNYLLAYYHKDTEQAFSAEEREKLAAVWQKSGRKVRFSPGNLLKRLLYVLGVFLLAVAVTTINDHEKMQGFVQTAQRTVFISSNY